MAHPRLETDAPASPEVQPELLVAGSHSPPYLLGVRGELYYRGTDSWDEERELIAETVERAGSSSKPPRVWSDLDSVRVDAPTVVEHPHVDPALVVRTYQYPVRLVDAPSERGFDGYVSVADPWAAGRVLRVNVHGEARPPILVSPSRLILSVSEPDVSRASVHFLAKANRERAPLRAEPREGQASPILVEATKPADEDGFAVFEVRWRPEEPLVEGVYHVIIRSEAADSETQDVPVLVQRREA